MWQLVFVVILVGVPLGILLQAYMQAKKKVAHIPGWTQLFPPIVYRNLPFLQAPISDTYQLFWKYAHEGYQNFGSIFKIVISGIYAVMISDPDFAKFVAVNHDKYFLKKLQRSEAIREEVGINIFNAHENDIWRRHRLLLNPAFSDESMAVVADATVSQTKQLMNDINKEPTRNVIPDMSNLTLNVIGYAGFGYEFNAFSLESQTNPDSVMNAQARFFYNGSRFSFFPKFMRHWTVIPFLKQYHRDKDTIKAAIGDIIDHRLKQQNLLESQRDILALLINAAKGVNEKDDDDLKPLTKQEMIADCITFIIAGHETTARTLAFAFHLLSLNPEKQKKAQEQVDKVLGSSDAPTIDQLEELTYIRGIMKETLRMYPAAVGTARVALQDFEFKNVVIPKGTQVLIHWHNIHMDDKYFKNAKEFIPERWDDVKDPGFCYSPFGVGKRSCIGRRFAEIEMMYVLSMFLKRYNVKHSEKSKEIDLEVNVTLMAKTPIHLTFEMR